MRKSLLITGGENLFQRIKRQCAEAQRNGVILHKLSIGQPAGPALLGARFAASEAIMSDKESMHEYQDNTCHGVPDFARRFVQCHVKTNLLRLGDDVIDFLPIPGIKPMLGVVIKSLGSWMPLSAKRQVGTMTEPGYPTPVDQCKYIRGVQHISLPLGESSGFLFSVDDLNDLGFSEGDMIMLNFPHNPSGIVAQREWLEQICAYCEENGIRIFNDAAYAILSHSLESVTLTDVAINFPRLSWAEAFSASKAGNNTGWRVAAMAGSPEFMGDVKTIKGNTDSGFVAAMASGIIELYERYPESIEEVRKLYQTRLDLLINILPSAGMQLAVSPRAGFFALFKCPLYAFGEKIKDADRFNELMIQNTGIVGVPFGPFGLYVRYAVCAYDVEANRTMLTDGFCKAQVSY